MSRFSAINLAALPPPAAVEVLSYEAIVAAMRAQLVEMLPGLAAVLELESEPINKLIEICAYRELLLRARINDAVHAVLLATALGSDLDNLVALFGVQRMVITPADPEADPPVAAVLEADDALRLRAQLALDGYTTAGSAASYEFHARTADAQVADVRVDSPDPGVVRVVILGRDGTGEATGDLVSAVSAALTAEEVRPLCDSVMVQSASIVPFAITATLEMQSGPDPAVVMAAAHEALASYLASIRGVGRSARRSGIFAALHRPGVERVVLTAPMMDLEIGATEAGHCTAITLSMELLG